MRMIRKLPPWITLSPFLLAMMPMIELYSHVDEKRMPQAMLAQLEMALNACLPDIMVLPHGPDYILGELESVEISIVDDPTIARVHADYLSDPSVTDVITFPHGDGLGEILVSIDTAIRQAVDFQEPWSRELFRYMVHGLLHLQGYLDADPADRELMFSYQEPLVLRHFPSEAS